MDVVRWSLMISLYLSSGLTFSGSLEGCWRLPSVTQHVLSAYASARKAYRQDDASTSDQEERRKPWSLHMIKTHKDHNIHITIDSSRYSQLLIFMGGGRGTIWYYMIIYDLYVYIYIINVDFLHYLHLTLVYHFLPTPPSDVSPIFTIRGWTCHQESLDDISTAASTSLGDGFEW